MRLTYRANIQAELRIAKAVVAGVLLLGLMVLFFVPPARLPLPACAFHSITGHSCLTCGLTRSLHAILHGDLAASVGYQLFGPAVFLGMLLCLVLLAAEAVSGKSIVLFAAGKLRARVIGMFAILWVVYCSFRLVAECIM
jgi:hypothetical protein